MNDDDPFLRAYNSALRLLSFRSRSEAELRTRLLRTFSLPEVESALARLKEQNLLDDLSFAQSWRRSRESSRPRSAFLIRRELAAKGIPHEIADAAVIDLDDEEGAYQAGLKVTRHLEKADFVTFRRKVWSHLRRLGFSASVIRGTINRLWQEKKFGSDEEDV
ncbi:MAG: regulatory protein RecX [Chloroflexi bacterium]|nr:regulatory protein RecX [Chloroflexota bacterium]